MPTPPGPVPGRWADADRTEYERDHDRILFSNAFRRLHDKTQVFPMPANDHIHSRLTHSLEVASVGRSLGRLAGATLVGRYGLDRHGLHARDIGDIVASACLAHDIGNPPFGHSGEDAIGRWFGERFAAIDGGGRPADPVSAALATFLPEERADLEGFEGNAQGFRVVTRLAMYPDAGGLRLTYATLGAFTKYPQGSLSRAGLASTSAPSLAGGARAAGPGGRPGVSRKKFGFFADDRERFVEVADALGLLPRAPLVYARHPLAFLMEAADDICYNILDLEDGFVLHKLTFAEVDDLLGAIVAGSHGARGPRAPRSSRSQRDQVAYLRARAIRQLIGEAVGVFCDHEAEILSGQFDQALIELCPSAAAMAEIKQVAEQKLYNAPDVVQILLAGYQIIGRLLDELLVAVLGPREQRDRKLLSILPEEIRDERGSAYQRTLRVTDYIAGMTDGFALKLYRNLLGLNLPLG